MPDKVYTLAFLTTADLAGVNALSDAYDKTAKHAHKATEESDKENISLREKKEITHETLRALGAELPGVGLFFGPPQVAAVAIFLEVLDTVIEKFKTLRDKQIEAAKAQREYNDAVEEGKFTVEEAVQTANRDYERSLIHAIDLLTKQKQQLDDTLDSIRAAGAAQGHQAASVESLADAYIRLAEAQGKITKTDADRLTQDAKVAAMRAKLDADEKADLAELAKLRAERDKEQAELDQNRDKPQQTRELPAYKELGVIASGLYEKIKKQTEIYNEASGTLTEKEASLRAGTPGGQMAVQEAKAAANAAEAQLNLLKAERASVAAEQEKIDYAINQMQARNDALAKSIDGLNETIKNKITQGQQQLGQEHNDIENQVQQNRIDRRTSGLNRLKDLGGKSTLTGSEQQELSDLRLRLDEASALENAQTPSQLQQEAQRTRGLVAAANAALTSAGRGQGNLAAVHEVLERMTGLVESIGSQMSASDRQTFQNYVNRLERVERNLSALTSRVNIRTYF